jgi:outer membrane protein, heavy metal efflux system
MSGSPEKATSSRWRRNPLKAKTWSFENRNTRAARGINPFLLIVVFLVAGAATAQAQASSTTQGPVRITLDDAIQLALQHNHNLLAAQTTILQAQAGEVAANVRPNPTLFTDWEYLPLGAPTDQNSRVYPPGYTIGQYLHDNTEADLGLSYLIERGKKRQARLQAAKDITAQTRSLVADNERTLTFNVASDFIAVQLAESALDLATKDVKSFRQTVDVSEYQHKIGGMSEGDFLMIKLQLLQYETDYQQAILARDQGLDDLRNLIGYDAVPADYDVAGSLDYEPLKANLEDLQMKALDTRPDLRAAQQGVTAASSQLQVQKTIAKQDVTASGNYSHVNGLNAATFAVSVPLAIFNQNRGPIAQARYAVTQAQEQQKAASDQVLTDVHDAFVGLQENDSVVTLYRNGYLDAAVRDRDIEQFAFQHGGASLLDWLNAERTYRATELAYRQALASYVTALEQLREAVGTRKLP